MTEAEALQASRIAKGRGMYFEITQKGELSDEKISWPGSFSVWLQNPRSYQLHRVDDFVDAEAVFHQEDEIKAEVHGALRDLDRHWRRLTRKM